MTNRNLVGVCLTFFCFDYYWYFLVNWLPDYLVTARGLTMMRAGIYAALPYLVFGMSEPIGGWLADRLVVRGWTQSRAREDRRHLRVHDGVAADSGRVGADARRGRGVHHRRMPGRPRDGQPAGRAQSCAPPSAIGLWTGIYNFIGNLAGIISPLITGFLIAQTGSYVPAFLLGGGSHHGRTAGVLVHRAGARAGGVTSASATARAATHEEGGAPGTAARVPVGRPGAATSGVGSAAARGPTRHPTRISGAYGHGSEDRSCGQPPTGPNPPCPHPARRAEPAARGTRPLAAGSRVACPRDVVMMVLRNGLWLTVAGVVVGLVATFAISRVLSGFLWRPVVFVFVFVFSYYGLHATDYELVE